MSLFLAGPRVETLPIRLFAMINFDLDPAVLRERLRDYTDEYGITLES